MITSRREATIQYALKRARQRLTDVAGPIFADDVGSHFYRLSELEQARDFLDAAIVRARETYKSVSPDYDGESRVSEPVTPYVAPARLSLDNEHA